MAQASSSSSSAAAIQSSGDLNINKPNWVPWVVLGFVAMVVVIAWMKGRK